MPLDPQAKTLLDSFAAMGGQALSAMSVADARRSMEILSAMRGTPTPVASAVDRRIPGPAGETFSDSWRKVHARRTRFREANERERRVEAG